MPPMPPGPDDAVVTVVAEAGAGTSPTPAAADVLILPAGAKSGALWPAAASLAAPSSLSPAAAPFFPGCSSGGRTKHRRWADDGGEETEDDPSASYLEAARRPAKPAIASPVRAQTCSIVVTGRDGKDTGQEPSRRRRKRSWPRPQLVHDLLARPMDGCVTRQRLGARRRVFAPNANGWWKILPRHETRPTATSGEPRRGPSQRTQA
jgi:hypothetical protein